MQTQMIVLVAGILLGISSPSVFAKSEDATHVPIEMFSIGEFYLGESTLMDVESKLGTGSAYEGGNGLVRTLCYFYQTDRGVVVSKFNANVLGGLQRLTGFSIQQASNHPNRCMATKINLGAMKIGKLIGLGISKQKFILHFPVRFSRDKARLSYDVEYRREMTEVEFASMQQQWPDIRQPSYFDVVESVRAEFRNGALKFYEVQRTESY